MDETRFVLFVVLVVLIVLFVLFRQIQELLQRIQAFQSHLKSPMKPPSTSKTLPASELMLTHDAKRKSPATPTEHQDTGDALTTPTSTAAPDTTRMKRRKLAVDTSDALDVNKSPTSHSAAPLPSPIPMGRTVAARIRKEAADVWILATVKKFNPERGKYDVMDAEPDSSSPDFKRIYSVTRDAVLALPQTGQAAPKLAPGTAVLAQYPDTTCFYNAVIYSPQTAQTAYHCKVQFEDDNEQVTEVVAHRVVVKPPSAGK